MSTLGVIPARYGSSRFPGKPLAIIDGKPMIQRVYERAVLSASLDKVVVATDDKRIANAVNQFKGEVIMTSDKHQTGTDRCREVLDIFKDQFDVLINIQGDEPFIDPLQIDQLCKLFSNERTQIGTLVKRVKSKDELFNKNKPKVVKDKDGRAIYFSRAVIPHQMELPEDAWISATNYWKHIGIYGYRSFVLRQITELPQSPLELSERLEQLRWIENGFTIMTAETNIEAFSVDTPEDLELLKQNAKP